MNFAARQPTRQELALFTRQLAALLAGGLTIHRGIEVLAQQHVSTALGESLFSVSRLMEGGQNLSRALGRERDVFDPMYVALVRSGEMQGNLDRVLSLLASYLERDAMLRARVKGALTYPAFVLAVTLALTFWFFRFVLPSFMPMLNALKEIPLPTRILMLGVDVASRPWSALIAIVSAVLIFHRTRAWLRTVNGAAFRDRMLLALPFTRELTRKVVLARIARSLGTMLASGVPVMDALLQTSSSCGHASYRDDIILAREALKRGLSLSTYMDGCPELYPRLFVGMVGSGEETGHLDELMLRIAGAYELDVEYGMETVITLLEPALMVLLAGLVGFIVIALFVPIYTFIGTMS